jgi:hypothetical protein
MADRVFPNSVKGKLDSKKTFTGINWDNVDSQVKKLRQAKASFDIGPVLEGVNQITTLDEEAQERVKGLLSSYARSFKNEKTAQLFVRKLTSSDDFDAELEQFEGLMKDPTDEIEDYIGMEDSEGGFDEDILEEEVVDENIDRAAEFDAESRLADEYLDTTLAKNKPSKSTLASKLTKKKKPAKNEKSKHTDKKLSPKERKEEFFKMKKINKKSESNISPEVRTRRVVAFTRPEQLSADAIEAAIASGDEELKNTILAARHQRRVAIAQKIEAARKSVVAQESTENSRTSENTRRALLAEAQEILDQHINEDYTEEIGFKSVDDLNESEKLAFSRVAERHGFPQEYINYMMSGGNDPSEEAQQIVELIRNDNLSREAKASAVKSMIKTATLSSNDVNYLRNYWLNVLGYDDPAAKEWVDALFTTKYNKKESSD